MTSAVSITVRVPLKIRRRPGRKTVVMPVQSAGTSADTTVATRADPALVKALARAFRYQRLLDEGRYASISEMAAAERIELAGLSRDGSGPDGVVLELVERAPLPADFFDHAHHHDASRPIDWE